MPSGNDVLKVHVSYGDISFSAEGDTETVLKLYDEFKQGSAVPGPPAEQHEGDPEKGKKKSGGRTPLPEFFRAHTPKTNPETVAVLVAWAHEHDGKAEVTPKEIEKLWRRTPRKKAGNLGRDIGVAVNKGWVDDAGHGKYSIPDYGLNFVKGLNPSQ